MIDDMANIEPVAVPPMQTLDEMLQGVFEAVSMPVPIGTLDGQVVTLDRLDRVLEWGSEETGYYSCPVDHPYVKGTKIYEHALRVLGELKTE